MIHRLTGPAGELADYMSEISERHWSAAWMHGLEWMLWTELQAWRMNAPPLHPVVVTGSLPRLDRLQKAAGGWVWRTEQDGPTFVAEGRWHELVLASASLRWFQRGDNEAIVARANAD